jgi:hypothetical protein
VPVRLTAAHTYDLEGELIGADDLVREAREERRSND